jgi:hypothetical protein
VSPRASGRMTGAAIRDELRGGTSRDLDRRRRIATLAGFGAVDFAIISLYQLGVIRHLPDPPGRLFDSDKVNAAASAYRFGAPDGPLGTRASRRPSPRQACRSAELLRASVRDVLYEAKRFHPAPQRDARDAEDLRHALAVTIRVREANRIRRAPAIRSLSRRAAH